MANAVERAGRGQLFVLLGRLALPLVRRGIINAFDLYAESCGRRFGWYDAGEWSS